MSDRVCRICGEADQTMFYDRAFTSGRAAGNCCRSCWITKSVDWRRNNRERWRRAAHRRNTINRLGITGEVYDALLPPDAACWACGSTVGITRLGKPCELTIDHDHRTGQVRGVLCHFCNLAVGQAGDDPVVLRALADYLDAAMRSAAAVPA